MCILNLSFVCFSLAVAWNKLLFDEFIPRAWVAFLEFVANSQVSLDLYDILPPLQDRRTSGDAKYWTSLLRDVVSLVLERDASVWPALSASSTASTCLADALVASWSDNPAQLQVLVKAGVVVILPPSSRT